MEGVIEILEVDVFSMKDVVRTMDVTKNGLDDMYTVALVVLKGGDIVGAIELYDGINRLENMELPLVTVNIVEKDDFTVEVLVLVVGATDVIISFDDT